MRTSASLKTAITYLAFMLPLDAFAVLDDDLKLKCTGSDSMFFTETLRQGETKPFTHQLVIRDLDTTSLLFLDVKGNQPFSGFECDVNVETINCQTEFELEGNDLVQSININRYDGSMYHQTEAYREGELIITVRFNGMCTVQEKLF